MFVGDGFRHWERLRLLVPFVMDGVIRCKAVGLTGLFTLNIGPEGCQQILFPGHTGLLPFFCAVLNFFCL
jgi:hypothetical protein